MTLKEELAEQFVVCWNSGAKALNSGMRVVFLALRICLIGTSNWLGKLETKWLKDA